MTDPFSSDGRKAPPKPFTVEEGLRKVRSFVLRQGRFTEAQQRAFDDLWPRFGLDYTGEPRDFDAAFGRKAKRILEIGFGNGEALRYSAQRDPARDHVGIEVHAPGVGRLLNALAAPIGSGLGVQNKYNLIEIVENAKVPIIVDAGVGTASDASIAMELGCDGVLMNTAIAGAQDPVRMALAMRLAIEAGRHAFLSGRIPRKRFASASSPVDGLIG